MFFLIFFRFCFGFFFPVFLGEVVLPAICNVLEFRPFLRLVFAAFWTLDLSLARSLQHFSTSSTAKFFAGWLYAIEIEI